MKTQLGSFKGNPTITLNPGAKYPFSFGPDKARMIVECFEEIKAFAEANPGKTKPIEVFASKGTIKSLSQYNDRATAEAAVNELQMLGFQASILAPHSNITLTPEQRRELNFQAARGRVL